MGRKKILEGGTRDKIIACAMGLFFEKGYEETSVRMILEKVNGEIGMFYHYFSSKDELFQVVVQRFFENYRSQFEMMTESCRDPDQFVELLFDYVEKGMSDFNQVSDKLHWTIRYAFAAKTVESLQPAFVQMLEHWEYSSDQCSELLAGQLLYAISGTIHSPAYQEKSTQEKKEIIRSLIDRVLRA